MASSLDIGITPGRVSRILFDVAEPVVSELPFAMGRNHGEITPDKAGSHDASQLGSGAWSLTPIQDKLSNISEVTDPTNSTINASRWALDPRVQQINTVRAAVDLPGATTGASPNLMVRGNPYLEAQVPDGGSFASSWSNGIADVTIFPIAVPSTNVLMDRVGIGTDVFGADSGFLLRFEVPGGTQESPDVLFCAYFGGPADQSKLGHYALAIRGDGIADLYGGVDVGTGLEWHLGHSFRYAEPHRVCGYSHSIRIRPYTGPGAKHIDFQAGLGDKSKPVDATKMNAFHQEASVPRGNTLTVNLMMVAIARQAYELAAMQPPTIQHIQLIPNASGPGQLRWDANRAYLLRLQASQLTYPPTGVLQDAPFIIPAYLPTLHGALTLYWDGTEPPGCSLVGALYNADDQTLLTSTATGTNWVSYQPVAGNVNGYYAIFDLESSADRTRAPILEGYRVVKDGQIEISTPGKFTGGNFRDFNLAGPDADPTHESGTAVVEDLAREMPRLYVRGDFACQIDIQPDPIAHPSRRVVAFRGRARRNVLRKRGRAWPAQTYPARGWSRIECSLLGDWVRIQQQTVPFPGRLYLDNDPTVPRQQSDSFVPYKVTDLIRAALGWAGFTPDMIDVPDLPMRFWSLASGHVDSNWLDPFTAISDFVQDNARDFLGAFVFRDANAGPIDSDTGTPKGMWRIRQATTPNANGSYTNVQTFVFEAPVTAGPFSVHPDSYPADTTFVRSDSYHTEVVPPEANLVIVVGLSKGGEDSEGGQLLISGAFNPDSADFQTTPGPNPDHPDFCPSGQIPIVYVDPGLDSQESVDWTCRRLFDRLCHAVQIATWDSPLVFITPDSSDTATVDNGDGTFSQVPAYATLGDGSTAQRMLRYYDPVLLGAVERQQIVITGTPTGGYYTISDGAATATVSWNASASAITSAIGGLAGGASAVVAGNTISVDFGGPNAMTAQDPLTVDGSHLVGATVSIVEVTKGWSRQMLIRSISATRKKDHLQYMTVEAWDALPLTAADVTSFNG